MRQEEKPISSEAIAIAKARDCLNSGGRHADAEKWTGSSAQEFGGWVGNGQVLLMT